jgi:hypothetical protein
LQILVLEGLGNHKSLIGTCVIMLDGLLENTKISNWYSIESNSPETELNNNKYLGEIEINVQITHEIISKEEFNSGIIMTLIANNMFSIPEKWEYQLDPILNIFHYVLNLSLPFSENNTKIIKFENGNINSAPLENTDNDNGN